MAQNVELAFRKREVHLMQQTGFDARCCNRGGNGSRTQAGLYGRAHRLFGWQL
jgi:hypothetical protein